MNPTMNPIMPALTCPKCHGRMRVYDRNGVTIDQCGDCSGIFLDRGELERLTDAEASIRAATPRLANPVAAHGDRSGGLRIHDTRTRGGFLSELFD
jgi:uncharacterized protein